MDGCAPYRASFVLKLLVNKDNCGKRSSAERLCMWSMVPERLRPTSLNDKSRHTLLMAYHTIKRSELLLKLRKADLHVATFENRCCVNPHTDNMQRRVSDNHKVNMTGDMLFDLCPSSKHCAAIYKRDTDVISRLFYEVVYWVIDA